MCEHVRTILTACVIKGAGVLKLKLFACCLIVLLFRIELNDLLTCVSSVVNIPYYLVFQLCVKIVEKGLILHNFVVLFCFHIT
jgi:hypothetical protein